MAGCAGWRLGAAPFFSFVRACGDRPTLGSRAPLPLVPPSPAAPPPPGAVELKPGAPGIRRACAGVGGARGRCGGSVGVRGAAARRAPRPDPALPLTAPLPPRSAFCPSTAPWVVWDPREALMAHVLAAHLERPGTCPHPQPHLRGRCRRDLLTGRGRRRRPGVPCRARARARSRGRATPRSPWWPAPRDGAAHGRVWGGSRPANRHAQAERLGAW